MSFSRQSQPYFGGVFLSSKSAIWLRLSFAKVNLIFGCVFLSSKSVIRLLLSFVKSISYFWFLCFKVRHFSCVFLSSKSTLFWFCLPFVEVRHLVASFCRYKVNLIFWLCLPFVEVRHLVASFFRRLLNIFWFPLSFVKVRHLWLRLCCQVRRIGCVFSLFDLH